MNKRLIVAVILLFGLILILPFAHDRGLQKEEGMRNPNYLNNYTNTGYFKIDPETILTSLDNGNTDVFTPLPEDPRSLESSTNVSFSWKQADILKIVGALGHMAWDDPMDLNIWKVYDFYLQATCRNNPDGFDFADITYFKTIKKVYATRHIEIDPYGSLVRWGSGATYSQPILSKWNSFDLAKTVITAEEALRISEEHGGKEARQQINNQCLIYISPSNDNDEWFVRYISTDFSVLINPYTGEYKISSTSK